MGNDRQPEFKETKPVDVVDLMLRFAHFFALAVTPVTRGSFGCRAFREGPYTAALMFFYAGLGHCPILVNYLAPWLVFVLFRRLTADPYQHSAYGGRVMLLESLFGLRLARLAEAALVGWIAYRLGDTPLGRFLMLVAASLLVLLWAELATYRARDIARRDAAIMARHMNGF